MHKILFRISVLLLCVPLMACEHTLDWKQEVQLHDGRVLEVNRMSKQSGMFPERGVIEYEQTLSFTNPDTQEKITWMIPKGLRPRMIDFDQKIPYIVFRAGSVANYNTWNCPNPAHIIFKYVAGKWEQITLDQLPARFTKTNTLGAAASDSKASEDKLVTIAEMQGYFAGANSDLREELSTISRKKIHPIAEGCHTGTLLEQGRESEINIPYINKNGIEITPKSETESSN